MRTWKLGCLSIIYFPASSLALTVFSFAVDELSFIALIISIFATLIYLFLSFLFYHRIYSDFTHRQFFPLATVLVMSPAVLFIAFFIYMNTRSHHFTLENSVDSPFDRIWYSWDQTAYGYPSPFLRFFHQPLKGFGDHLYDFSSFFGNIDFMLFALSIYAAAVAVFLRIRKTIKTIQSTPPRGAADG